MAKSLFHTIKQLVEEDGPLPWKYYQYWEPNIDVEMLFSKDGSTNFIKDYFSAGRKESPLYLSPYSEEFQKGYTRHNKANILLDRSFSIDNLSDNRAIHTVSAFFLGIIIENALFGSNHLTVRVNGDDSFTIPYIWFLTSLYHDIGYQFEQNEEFYSYIKQHLCGDYYQHYRAHGWSRALNIVFRNLDISLGNSPPNGNRIQSVSLPYALYANLLGYAKDIHHYPIQYSNGAVIRNGWYHAQTVRNYFDYRFSEMSVCDHGIVGGYLFLDRIIKNYVTTYISESTIQGELLELDDFHTAYSNLHFSKHQLPIFRHISDCIMAHNVYKAAEDKADIYRAYKLDELISDHFSPINSEEAPLLYILALADTLDPVKIYGKATGKSSSLLPKAILENISFEYFPGKRSITIITNKTISIAPIYEAALGLESWTKAIVNNKTNTSFNIIL